MNATRRLLLLLVSLAPACSSAPQNGERGAAAATNATASSAVTTATVDAPAATPDEILQARLREAVRGLQETLDARAPDFEAWGQIGVPGSSQPVPSIRMGATSVSGRLAPKVVQRVVRASFGGFRLCYEAGLQKDPKLQGQVTVSFTIGNDGSVSDVTSGSDLPDKTVVACVTRRFSGLSFPTPEKGIVKVTYPLLLLPPGEAPPSSPAAAAPSPSAAAGPSPSAAAAPLPSAPTVPEVPTDPAGPWPITVIDGTALRIDGAVVADTKALLELGRMQKLDGLFDALRAQRESWKASHPNQPFPGVAGLRAGAEVPLLAFKSVFQTMAFAGYPHLYVQSATDPNAILAMAAQVPGPPRATAAVPSSAGPEPSLHLRVEAGELTLVWKQGATVLSEAKLARDAADLTRSICEDRKTHSGHHEPSDRRMDALILQSDDKLPLRELDAIAQKALACTRERRDASGAARQVPAFWITFSVR